MTDLIIYFAIACVLVFMLFTVLGKDVGEPPNSKSDNGNPLDALGFGGKSDQPELTVVPKDPIFKGPAGKGLSAIAGADAQFSPGEFLDGAKAAYAMILEAFVDGDKEALQSLLSEPMFDAYADVIHAREKDGHSQKTDLARIISAQILTAGRESKTGSIGVEFDAELSTALYDGEGSLVEGDPDLLNRVTELWTFERRLGSSNPNWVLISVEEQGEDTPGSAPDFTPQS